jgi:hypothetical protein
MVTGVELFQLLFIHCMERRLFPAAAVFVQCMEEDLPDDVLN